jgi:hypothetical protein
MYKNCFKWSKTFSFSNYVKNGYGKMCYLNYLFQKEICGISIIFNSYHNQILKYKKPSFKNHGSLCVILVT